MNGLEDRVRRALRADLPAPGTDRLLDDVHRGATRRRWRKVAGTVGASVIVLAGAAGAVTSLADHPRTAPAPPPASQVPSPSPTESPLPDGATRGTVAVSAVPPDLVFRMTMNVGCHDCSTVWRGVGSGAWERLHDFAAENAAELEAGNGPVSDLVMARNGHDGWVWGKPLYSTHDGGYTWTRVTNRPGPTNGSPHFVAVTDRYAWGLSFDKRGAHLYRTPLGTDDWAIVAAPHLDRVIGLDTVGDRVVLEQKPEGTSNGSLVSSADDGATWSTLELPCPGGEDGGYAELELCMHSAGAQSTPSVGLTVYRTTDFASWSVLGHITGGIDSLQPISDDRVLVVLPRRGAVLMGPHGTTPVDLPLAAGDQTDRSSWSGDVSYVTVYGEVPDYYLITSTDRGRTWRRMP